MQVQLHLWDIADQHHFCNLIPSYIIIQYLQGLSMTSQGGCYAVLFEKGMEVSNREFGKER